MAWRVGVIGTGWGRTHVAAFRRAGWEVTALCGRSLARTARVAQEEGIPWYTTDYQALVGRSDVDLVVVASPHHLHAAMATAALVVGKHVLCEKPMAFTVNQARAMVDIASRYPDRIAAVNFPSRFIPTLQQLRELLPERLGSLWDVRHTALVRFPPDSRQWAWDPLVSLGELGEMGSHLLDQTLWLTGQLITGVMAWAVGEKGEDLAVQPGTINKRVGFLCRFQGGGVGFFSSGDGHEPGIRIAWEGVGERGVVRWRLGYDPRLGGWYVDAVEGVDPEGKVEVLLPGERVDTARPESDPWFAAHVATARALREALEKEDRAALGPMATFADGLRVQEVMDAVLRSARQGVRVEVEG